MLNAKLLSLITKLTGAMLSAKDVGVKNNAPYDQKPAYKPVNGTFVFIFTTLQAMDYF